MRLHVGNGSILLRGWLNVDLPKPNVFLAKERPDLVERFITTEDQYYARHENKTMDTTRKGPVTEETVCDAYGSFDLLPARTSSVTEILTRQCFEHLNMEQAKRALTECRRVLKPEGTLRIDIPDPDRTLRKYLETGDDFYRRHLFGPRLDEYGFHTHYTRSMLAHMAEVAGFRFVEEEENIHFYPAFCLRFAKN